MWRKNLIYEMEKDVAIFKFRMGLTGSRDQLNENTCNRLKNTTDKLKLFFSALTFC
jgi:hypothetical protein